MTVDFHVTEKKGLSLGLIRHYNYHIYHFDHEVHENMYVYGSDD